MTDDAKLSKGAATRQRIIEASLTLFQRQGYHGTGLASIVEQAGAPKGSMYFHFPNGKEEIAREAVALAEKEFSARIAEAANIASKPAEVVGAVIDALATLLEDGDYRVGCPVSVVTLEAGATSNELRQACAHAYDAWQLPIVGLLEANGWASEAATSIASSIVSMVEGATITSRAHRSIAPLRDAGKTIEILLALPGTGERA